MANFPLKNKLKQTLFITNHLFYFVLIKLHWPKWVKIEAYLAVPVKLLPVLKGICYPVWEFLYFFAKPKSIKYIIFLNLFNPVK